MGPDGAPQFLDRLDMIHSHTHGLHKAEQPIAVLEGFGDPSIWFEVARGVRFLTTYLPGVADIPQNVGQIVNTARLASAGHYDTDVAERYGVSRSVVRTNRHRVSIACALAFPDTVDLADANQIARSPNNIDSIYRVADIFHTATRLKQFLHSDHPLVEQIAQQSHFHNYLYLFANGYGFADIEAEFGFEVPQASRHKASEAVVNWLCYQDGPPSGLHTYLKRMVFQRWIDQEENWCEKLFTEDEYQRTMDEVNARGGSGYVYALRKYAYFRELVNENPDDFLPRISLELSPYTGLSPATQYFIASYVAGYQAKELAGPIIDFTAYSPKTVGMALSAGIRFTENILLAPNRIGGLSRKGSMSRANQLKEIYRELPALVHTSQS